MPGKYVDWHTITAFVEAAFQGYGVPAEEAKICTDVLIEADRRGITSHGVNRLKPIYLDRIQSGIQNPITKFEILRETPTTAVVDGHHGMGQVIAHRAMSMAIDKAQKLGMGMVAVRNSTHYGIAGYYGTMATKANCLGLTGTNARPSVAPTFGTDTMMGTNPLCIALPTDEEFPFVIDCATSTTQRGKIEYWARLDKETPAGLVVTEEGGTLTDSQEILEALTGGKAAFVPLGGKGEELAGYKGYGYCCAVEILSAALQSGHYLKMLAGLNDQGEAAPYGLGHFFVAIDTEAFLGSTAFKKTAGNILRSLRSSQKEPGAKKIFTAGEKEYRHKEETAKKGLWVNESVQKELYAIQSDLGLEQFSFLF